MSLKRRRRSSTVSSFSDFDTRSYAFLKRYFDRPEMCSRVHARHDMLDITLATSTMFTCRGSEETVASCAVRVMHALLVPLAFYCEQYLKCARVYSRKRATRGKMHRLFKFVKMCTMRVAQPFTYAHRKKAMTEDRCKASLAKCTKVICSLINFIQRVRNGIWRKSASVAEQDVERLSRILQRMGTILVPVMQLGGFSGEYGVIKKVCAFENSTDVLPKQFIHRCITAKQWDAVRMSLQQLALNSECCKHVLGCVIRQERLRSKLTVHPLPQQTEVNGKASLDGQVGLSTQFKCISDKRTSS